MSSSPAPLTPDPHWWRQAVVYQIYPRSFTDSDGDGLGDVRGVISRIPYLARLGIDAIWLSPFYPSPLADGGYDVIDYRDVDPRLGTLVDADLLVEKAHAAGIRVIVDIVPNHTSDRHPRFQAALDAGPGSAEREWYIFRDGRGPDGALPPSDWTSHFGGSAWERVPDGQWYLHLFAREQPDLNWQNPQVREDFHRTLRFWGDRGIDGFRVDVAHALAKDLSEPLRSQTSRDHDLPLDGSDPLYDRDEVHDIFSGWRQVLNEYDPPRSAVAEAWVPAARRVLYARPTELGQAFNFDLLTAPFSAEQFRLVIAENLAEAQVSGASSTWVLSNHDVMRHPTRYALPPGTDPDAWLMSHGTAPVLDEARGRRRAMAATLLMLGLPGSAYLYQGEELGLFEVADLPPEALQDPIWERDGRIRKGRDGCRVPLPWDTSDPALGFSTTEPWLPQPRSFADHAVAVQDGEPGSVLEFYRSALALRHELQRGEDLDWLTMAADAQVLYFARHEGWQVVTNFGEDPVPLPPGQVLLAGAEIVDGRLPGETTAWLRPPGDAK